MFNRLKLNIIVILSASTLLTATLVAPYTNLIGKNYNSYMDYTCCKGDQLYVHHYYTQRLFGLKMNEGYTIEAIGKPTPGGCNVQCTDEIK